MRGELGRVIPALVLVLVQEQNAQRGQITDNLLLWRRERRALIRLVEALEPHLQQKADHRRHFYSCTTPCHVRAS
jgi:hypothetical protein